MEIVIVFAVAAILIVGYLAYANYVRYEKRQNEIARQHERSMAIYESSRAAAARAADRVAPPTPKSARSAGGSGYTRKPLPRSTGYGGRSSSDDIAGMMAGSVASYDYGDSYGSSSPTPSYHGGGGDFGGGGSSGSYDSGGSSSYDSGGGGSSDGGGGGGGGD